jgi:hypothetical protein
MSFLTSHLLLKSNIHPLSTKLEYLSKLTAGLSTKIKKLCEKDKWCGGYALIVNIYLGGLIVGCKDHIQPTTNGIINLILNYNTLSILKYRTFRTCIVVHLN